MSLPYRFKVEALIKEGRTSWNFIQNIKKYLKTASSLPDLQDEFVALFLLSCRNNLEQTQKTLVNYFRLKNDAPEIFSNRDIDNEDLTKAMKVTPGIAIPTRTNDNTAVHFFKFGDTDPRNFNLTSGLKLAFMLLDVSQRHNPPERVSVVVDTKGVSFMHLTHLDFSVLKKALAFMREGMPVKVGKLHVLNANYVFENVVAIAGVFVKKETLSEVLVIHPPGRSMEEFREEHLPASVLPKEYGGSLPAFEELRRSTVEELRNMKPFFKAEEELRNSAVNITK